MSTGGGGALECLDAQAASVRAATASVRAMRDFMVIWVFDLLF
jgi:hypothetical protein